MKKLTLWLLLAISLLPACTKKEAPAPAKPVRISATRAYEKFFGPAPTTDKGTCFAFVIYFPSPGISGKVVPFPFFTFDEATIQNVAVERLLGGMDVGSYKGEFIQPFAPGAHLVSLSRQKGVVSVDLSKGFLRSGMDPEGMLNALVMTLTQFDGVKGVRLLSEGKLPAYAPGTILPDPSSVSEPGPPRLLSVTAVKEKGAKGVDDVSAYFDRPVNIMKLSMTDSDGKPFAGDVFQSVFDMAAVLKPQQPSAFKAGMPVKVQWSVVDKAGRPAAGDGEYPLEVKEH